MLEKQNRLRKNKEYNYVYKKGEGVFSKTLSLFYVRTNIKPFKIGFSISNKVGNSVVRHKIRRRLAHIARTHLSEFNPGYNYVFTARPGFEELSFDEIVKNVRFVLKKFNDALIKKTVNKQPVNK